MKKLRVMEAHNGLSALLVDKSSFDAIWLGSLSDSSIRGLPDNELVTYAERINTVREIRRVTDKPIIIDGDTGGQIEHFSQKVRDLEIAGVNAIIIEDKQFPKQNSLLTEGKHILEDIDKFCEKIKIGKESCGINIFARIEALIARKSMYSAMLRAEAYIEAGADGIMIHSKKSQGDEVFEFAKLFKKKYPNKVLVCVPTTYNIYTAKQLFKKGFDVVIHANQLLRVCHLGMKNVIKEIEKEDKTSSLDKHISSVKDIFQDVGH